MTKKGLWCDKMKSKETTETVSIYNRETRELLFTEPSDPAKTGSGS